MQARGVKLLVESELLALVAIPQLADMECVGEFMPLGEWRGHAEWCASHDRSIGAAAPLAGIRRQSDTDRMATRVNDPYAVIVADDPAALGQQRPLGVVVGAQLDLPAVAIAIA
jgi:hypothetical protein